MYQAGANFNRLQNRNHMSLERKEYVGMAKPTSAATHSQPLLQWVWPRTSRLLIWQGSTFAARHSAALALRCRSASHKQQTHWPLQQCTALHWLARWLT